MPGWFAVSTQPNAESRAATNLLRQGFGVYLPRYRKIRRHARRVEEVLRPLFPGYLFVRLDAATSRWQAIRSTIGVRDLVLAGDRPSSVPDKIVDQIKAHEDTCGLVRMSRRRKWKPGDQLRITCGPLADLIGLFQSVTDDERVIVLLRLLGREMQIPLPADAIDALT